MNNPISLRIVVADGDPDGVRAVERSNWIGNWNSVGGDATLTRMPEVGAGLSRIVATESRKLAGQP